MKAISVVVLVFCLLLPLPSQAARGFPLNVYGLTIIIDDKGITRAEAIKRGNGVWAVPANFNVGPQKNPEKAFDPMGTITIDGQDATVMKVHRDENPLHRPEAVYSRSARDLDIGRDLKKPAGSYSTQVGPSLRLERDGSLEMAWAFEGFTEKFVTDDKKERSLLCTDNAQERGSASFDTVQTLQFYGALGYSKDSPARKLIARKMKERGLTDCLNLDGNSALEPDAKNRVYWVFCELKRCSRVQASKP